MPYKSFKRGNKYKVYRLDEQGQPVGDALGTHANKGKADEQVRALYANETAAAESERKVRSSDLHELVTLQEGALDADNHTVKVSLIKPGWSSNGRYYSDRTLRDAAGLWEGVKAYADHPGRHEAKDRPERSVRDIVGVYENVTHDGDATRADFRILGAAREWLWPLIEESVNTKRDLIGLSINALGRTAKGEAEGKRGIVVEAITHANSVDVVTEPAAGGGFEQLIMSDDGWTRAVLDSVSLEEIREARPEIIETLKREWKQTRDSAALAEAKTRADRAEAKAAALEKEKRAIQSELRKTQQEIEGLRKAKIVDSLLESAKLPGAWVEDLRIVLMGADPGDWAGILEAEKRKAKAVKPKTRVTGAGVQAGPQPARLRETNWKNPSSMGVAVVLDESAPQPGESYNAWKSRTNKT